MVPSPEIQAPDCGGSLHANATISRSQSDSSLASSREAVPIGAPWVNRSVDTVVISSVRAQHE